MGIVTFILSAQIIDILDLVRRSMLGDALGGVAETLEDTNVFSLVGFLSYFVDIVRAQDLMLQME